MLPFLLTLLIVSPAGIPGSGAIRGVAVNGTTNDEPLAGATVVLRAVNNGSLVPLEETTTDERGRFAFNGLPTNDGKVYLPGVNRQGVHFPGRRLVLKHAFATETVKLVAFDAIESPSPLLSRQHRIDLRANKGFFEVHESMLIDNPSRTAYVGEASQGPLPVTLRIRLPERVERVTFAKEFHGRQFAMENGAMTTDMPWPPGERTIEFYYRLPIEQSNAVFSRTLDLPTRHLRVSAAHNDSGAITCNLARLHGDGHSAVFAQQAEQLPPGFAVKLDFGSLPVRLEFYTRWLAAGVLGLLITGTLVWQSRQRNPTVRAKQVGRPSPQKARVARRQSAGRNAA